MFVCPINDAVNLKMSTRPGPRLHFSFTSAIRAKKASVKRYDASVIKAAERVTSLISVYHIHHTFVGGRDGGGRGGWGGMRNDEQKGVGGVLRIRLRYFVH